MYQPPYSVIEIKKHFPSKAKKLLRDPAHLFRAKTGIELIHKEPNKKEQLRIWENWQQMTDGQKKISDQKSVELFGLTNQEHHLQLVNQKS